MAKSDTYFYGLGRRKAATARARLMGGKGKVTINGSAAEEYFDGNKSLVAELTDPLVVIGKQDAFDVTIVVSGGGMSGQVDACKLAIAKSISEMDESLRGTLKKAGHLKRDPRAKERKKPGQPGARKRFQFSKR